MEVVCVGERVTTQRRCPVFNIYVPNLETFRRIGLFSPRIRSRSNPSIGQLRACPPGDVSCQALKVPPAIPHGLAMGASGALDNSGPRDFGRGSVRDTPNGLAILAGSPVRALKGLHRAVVEISRTTVPARNHHPARPRLPACGPPRRAQTKSYLHRAKPASPASRGANHATLPSLPSIGCANRRAGVLYYITVGTESCPK